MEPKNVASSATEPLGVGEVVILKNPGSVPCKVTKRREADFGLPEGEAWYEVEVIPRKQWRQREDLEPTLPPSPDRGRLEYLTPEWVEELKILNEKVGLWIARRDDQGLLREITGSMGRLGFPA
jgi:hypothetical protein